MHGTQHIHVFGPDGALEYSYHRKDNFWRSESPEALRLKEIEIAEINALMRENVTANAVSLAQKLREAHKDD